ncbi:MAG: PKD domain-containing protein [Desulfobulbaceae bacterium]
MVGLVAPIQSRVIQTEWEYQYNENLSGFRLYHENNPVCEKTDPTATSMNCEVEAPDGETQFTLTAFFQDNTESPHSAPFFYIFSSALKAIFNADVLEGESPLPVSFDATSSTGNIVLYEWLYGDGETGNGNIVNHIFPFAGNYTVKLKVNDDIGAFDQETTSIAVTTPSAVNTSPNAVISTSTTVGNAPLQVQFDGSGSTDGDGSIISYAWDMGDGGVSTGPQTTYTYYTPGNFNATLTVTDEGGLTDSISTPVLVGAPKENGDNQKPTAVIIASKSTGIAPLSVSFDASGSFDPDGKITKYSWNFGDGSSATGISVHHNFVQTATYTVTLRVTDNLGVQSELAQYNVAVLKPGTVIEPPPGGTTGAMPFVINLLLNGAPLSNLQMEGEASQAENPQ